MRGGQREVLWSLLPLPIGAGGREAMELRGEMVMGIFLPHLLLEGVPGGGADWYCWVCKAGVGLSDGTTGEEPGGVRVSRVLFLN